jgi:hypothetical protein
LSLKEMYENYSTLRLFNILPVEKWPKTDLLYTCKKKQVKGYTRMDKPQLIEEVKKIMDGMKGEKL